MGLKLFFSLLFFIIVVLLLSIYWFIPVSETEVLSSVSSNKYQIELSQAKQFYPNMRFPSPTITFRIDDCTLQKEQDMLRAFEIVAEKTNLEFVQVRSNEDIIVLCDSATKIDEGMFIAGEGGPTNITKAGEFNVITKGKILLLKESKCPNPNVAIHELLHVLGFDHVENPNDIMYEISKCNQEISPSTIDTINFIYSIPSYPDLVFENVAANMQGKYLNLNISIRNNGLVDSDSARIVIYADDSAVKEIRLDSLNMGHGRMITLTNIWISQLSIETIGIKIISNFNELKKENNELLLKVKK